MIRSARVVLKRESDVALVVVDEELRRLLIAVRVHGAPEAAVEVEVIGEPAMSGLVDVLDTLVYLSRPGPDPSSLALERLAAWG
jgi:hypothetical protein